MKNPPVLSDVEYIVLPEAEPPSETSLVEYIQILYKRKWWVIAPAFLIVPAVILLLAVKKPMYEAVATLLIEDVNPRVLSIQEVLVPERSPNFYKTQYELIKIRDVVEEVVDRLQLDQKVTAELSSIERMIQSIRRFSGKLVENVVSYLRDQMSETKTTSTPDAKPQSDSAQPRYRAISRLQNALKIVPREETKLVDISLQGENPKEVTEQVNMVATIFEKQNLDHKLAASRKAITSLQKEAESLQQRVRNAEAALQNFIDKKQILVSGGAETRRDTSYQKLDALQSTYAQTNADWLVLQTRIAELEKVGKDNFEEFLEFSDVSNSSSIKNLKDQYSKLKYQYINFLSKYQEKHPKVVRIKYEMDKTRDNILEEINNVLNGLKKEENALMSRNRALEEAVNNQKNDVLDLGKEITKYNELQHNVEVEKELYLAVTKRLAETKLAETFATNNVKIVESALVPDQPIPSLNLIKLILSLILSLVCGAGIALIMEYRDKRLKTIVEVEKDLNLPFLGYIPRYKIGRGRDYRLITLQDPTSIAAESYRMLRTMIQNSGYAVKTLLITSVTPDEGKTTTAANLAISFAQLGKTVLLVDADLRRPSMHRTFYIANHVGLADCLQHGIDWSVAVRDTPLRNLKVMPAGATPHYPSELLSSRHMQTLLQSWKVHFDLIIFDSPIVAGVPDVAVMAPAMDGVLLVHYPVTGDKEALLHAKKLLDRVGANCIGLIFNNIKSSGKEQYYASPYGSLPPSRVAKLPANGWSRSDFLDIQPAESGPPPRSDAVPGQADTTTRSGALDKSAQSTDLHITLKSFLTQPCLGEASASSGFSFLTLDVAIYNGTEQTYLFDPAWTTLTVNGKDEYRQPFDSLLAIPTVNHAAVSQASQIEVRHCAPITQALENGIADAVMISPKSLRCGRLVYQVPDRAQHYLFGYEHDDVSIAIDFSAPSAS